MNDIREELAEYAHSQWSGWMKYLFSKCACNPDGSRNISPTLVDRWLRQMNTPYKELPEDEKPSDRKEADGMIEIMKKYSEPVT